MFCSKCGTKLEDNAKFCPQCGTEVAGGDGSVASVDLQSMKSKTSSVISALRNLDKKKTLYGIIISFVLVILFGWMTVNVLNPAKKVKAEVTYASEPYTNYSTGTFYQDTYYQRVSITYKGKEYTGIREIGLYNPYGTLDTSCHIGSKITAYIVNGNLTLDKGTAKVNIIGAGFSILLLLGSIGSCGWFALQYFKKRG
ncbi:MAG: zinc-ribbon domain-containing protein [Lachnospiraceae bacterium]|nr:zinc-ribbon domain-containing protein [Lachnospiraceae bacterium]